MPAVHFASDNVSVGCGGFAKAYCRADQGWNYHPAIGLLVSTFTYGLGR